MSQYSYQIVDNQSDFRSLKDDWNRLEQGEFFHQWFWGYHWWENFQSRGKLSVVVVRDSGDRVVGIAPWFTSYQIGRGKIVQNLTAGETCSDYQSVLVEPIHHSGVSAVLSDLICSENGCREFADVDAFEVEGHRQQDPFVNRLMCEVEDRGGLVESCELGGTWRTLLPETWDQYMASVRSSFRRKIRKAVKRLEGDEFEFRTTLSYKQFVDTWPEFVSLHQKRRNFLGEPGCFADKSFEAFLHASGEDFAKESCVRINSVAYRGKLIGTSIEFISGSEVWMYQSGADPDYMKYEPGHLVFTASLQQAISERRTVFDFLRGDEPYKAKWNAQRHRVLKTTFVPNRILARCRHCTWDSAVKLKSWAKAAVKSS